MIKLIERGPYLDNSRRLIGISVYYQNEDDDLQWIYSGSIALPPGEWERLKAVIEVGSEENPVGFEYELVKVS